MTLGLVLLLLAIFLTIVALVRPRRADVLFGIALLLLAVAVWLGVPPLALT